MRIKHWCTKIAGVVLMTFLASTISTCWADCGSIPFYAPVISEFDVVDSENEQNLIKFDPLSVTVFEPRQRAIILWNGEEQILLLSTDQRTNQPSAVLEVIPLPSEPQVEIGSFETFEVAQKLMVRKHMWACAHGGARAGAYREPENAGRITFHKKAGAHDLSVAKVLDKNHFLQFVQNYLMTRYETGKTPIKTEFVKTIESYLDEGFQWFAFDVITLDGSTKSREPVQYRFKTDCVYYPMRISTQEKGDTEVDLLVFSQNGANSVVGFPRKELNEEEEVGVTRVEVEELERSWQNFFKNESDLRMDRWQIKGDISTFMTDVRAF
jgi:hypothetical protein